MTRPVARQPVRILHLEDSPNDREIVRDVLEHEGVECTLQHVETREEFLAAIETREIDLIVSDHALPTFDGESALRLVKEMQPHIPFIFLTGSLGDESAVEKMRNGATDYVLKHRLARLVPAIQRALKESAERIRREQAEEHIHEQAALLEQSHDAIYVRDLNQKITFWNPAATRLYGWSAGEALGRRADEMLYRGESPVVLDVRRQVMEKGEWTGELRQFTKSGGEVVVLARRTLLFDGQGRPRCILNINTDITEKKLLQEQLLRTQRMESIGALAGGIAHDLNNVLAPILMATDLLRDEVRSESSRLMLDTLKSSAQRGSEMVKQILSFARGTGSKLSVLQAGHLLAEMARLAKETFPHTITVKTQIPRDLVPVKGNPTQIHQVLLNLCVNARDAMPDGGTLWLTGENVTLREKTFATGEAPVSGSFAVLAVSDSGTGIPPHLLATIFVPFFTTKGEGKGTGIGLSTVQSIVKAHAGYIEVESKPGAGSSFRIYLPAASGPDGQNAAPAGTPPPQGNGELILLMDDELALLEITKGLLESYNYRVLTAANGADALVLFHQNHHEVRAVITDMMTPIMDGAALIRVLGQIAPRVKVIAVSGHGPNESAPPALGPNACLRLTKPYSTEQILTALHDVLKS